MITGCGQGNVDYIVPGLLGFLVGGILFGVTYQSVFLKISGISALGKINLASLLQVNHWLLISLFVLCTAIFYVASKLYELRIPAKAAASSIELKEIAR